MDRPADAATAAARSRIAVVAALRPQVAAWLDAAHPDGRPDQRWEQTVAQAVDEVLRAYARHTLAAGRPPLDVAIESQIAQALRAEFLGAGGLQALLDDDTIETININGPRDVWLHRSDGSRTRAAPVAASQQELVALLRDLATRAGSQERRFAADSPELSLQLLARGTDGEPAGGARLHAIMDITDEIAVSIRRHRLLRVSLDDLVRMGTLTPGLRQVLGALVRARRNLVVSGGPAAGKTTLLRALAAEIAPQVRLIVVEDTSELALSRQEHPNLVTMQARLPNAEGVGEFTLDDCVRASLRLAPDRVIVGEVRGAEVTTMAKAMSIGAPGSLATVHAESSRQAFLRLVTYAMEPPASYSHAAATALIAGAVHAVIHLDQATDGTRVVASIREVVGEEDGQILSNEVYQPGPDRRAVPASRFSDHTMTLLTARGLDPAALEPAPLDEPRWRR
jgi:Flp pilus assembly CpaF family ATPase